MVAPLFIEYLHAGGNRQPGAADWDSESGIIAFGSDQNVALWHPLQEGHFGISALLKGHTGLVNSVKFLPSSYQGKRLLLTGGSDSTVRLWQLSSELAESKCLVVLGAHHASLNNIATIEGSNIFITASADSSICIWRFDESHAEFCILLKSFSLNPTYIPLAICLHRFPNPETEKDSFILAIAGTRTQIQVFTLLVGASQAECDLQASLSGHEGWVRSLTATADTNGDVLIASASQDKYIRLWRIKKSDDSGIASAEPSGDLLSTAHPLKKKVQVLKTPKSEFTVAFEALLFGHEDWIYTAAWNPKSKSLQLLTTSADNSLSVWEADETSGIWTSTSRLGEISEQKGSTTATGSSGGLWAGLWSPNGNAIACLGRTGSWRLWQFDTEKEYWISKVGICGHTRSVSDVSWEPHGQYLLSTSLDQTSRLHAQWKQKSAPSSWHEFSRPQIHGYDLNCLTSLGQDRFVSGADEKLLRVFDEPKAVGKLLENLCGITSTSLSNMPEAADMPVLGLSNKAVDEDVNPEGNEEDADVQATIRHQLEMDQPPLEDHLARHTLWPETEKLYGHGYEISAVASSHDHSIIATACKASSLDHAVIRLYNTRDWHEIRPPLSAHTLTITSLKFSPDDRYLLSVGRDRQWAVFEKVEDQTYKLATSNPKGHSRMILDAAWAPVTNQRVFATAGRDKLIKLWKLSEDAKEPSEKVKLVASIARPNNITALDFALSSSSSSGDEVTLAAGEEGGQLSLHTVSLTTWEVKSSDLPVSLNPSKAITRLAWRPAAESKEDDLACLAVASADCSLRLIRTTL